MSDCDCICAGCSLHVEEKDRWPFLSYEAVYRLEKLACQILGHKPKAYMGWVECNRCREHLSGPRPSFTDRTTAYISEAYGLKAKLTGIRDSLLIE